VGEERGGKEMNGCPLTTLALKDIVSHTYARISGI
jgi:hypothetical protein